MDSTLFLLVMIAVGWLVIWCCVDPAKRSRAWWPFDFLRRIAIEISCPRQSGKGECRHRCGLAATAVVLYHASRHLDKIYGVPILRDTLQFGHAGVDLFFVGMTPSGHNLILGIAWTLRFELVFYVIFSILILNRISGLTVLAVWLAAIVAVAIARTALPGPAGLLTGAFNLQFFFGMAIAYTLRHSKIAAPRLWLAAGASLFAAAAVAEGMGLLDGYADHSRLIYGIPSALIIFGAAEAGRQGHLIVPAPLRVLGAASYSIYLFQFVFIGVFWQLWLHAGLDRWTPHIASFPLLAGSGIGGGIIMSRWVEHPLIRLVRGGGGKAQPRAAIG